MDSDCEDDHQEHSIDGDDGSSSDDKNNDREDVVAMSRNDDIEDSNGGRLSHEENEHPVPLQHNPVQPIGGTVSTNRGHSLTYATGNEVDGLLDTLMQRDEQTCDHVITETGVVPRYQVHLHMTQTNIHNPGAVTLGGHVIVKLREHKAESPRRSPYPTEVQKLRCETERTFEKWTEGMVKTRATQTVLDKISQGMTWITIEGSPGEGKTTAGYLALKHLHSMGREVYEIKTPEDYFKIKDA